MAMAWQLRGKRRAEQHLHKRRGVKGGMRSSLAYCSGTCKDYTNDENADDDDDHDDDDRDDDDDADLALMCGQEAPS